MNSNGGQYCSECNEGSIQISHSSIDILNKGTATVKGSLANGDSATFIYLSLNPLVASVNSNGVITANSVGTTTIRVSALGVDGYAECNVNVLPREFTVTWNVNGKTSTQKVKEGSPIVPNVNTDIPGYKFVSWDGIVPPVMPSSNLSFTAILVKQADVSKDSEPEQISAFDSIEAPEAVAPVEEAPKAEEAPETVEAPKAEEAPKETQPDDSADATEYVPIDPETGKPVESFPVDPDLDVDNHITGSIATYKKVGPKNEVYLTEGQAIVLKVAEGNTYYVGLKSLTGKAVTAHVSGIDLAEPTAIKFKHTTDMYYQVTPVNGYIVIQNGSGSNAAEGESGNADGNETGSTADGETISETGDATGNGPILSITNLRTTNLSKPVVNGGIQMVESQEAVDLMDDFTAYLLKRQSEDAIIQPTEPEVEVPSAQEQAQGKQ